MNEGNERKLTNWKLNSSTWSSNGTIICTATGEQKSPQLIRDGNGGAIITWYDYRNGNDDIYAQKIDSTGNIQWEENGTIICNEIGNQFSPNIISDNNGGAIITWYDQRDGSSENDIYAQKIDANGAIQWKENGTVICNASNEQYSPEIINDGNGGAIITWYDQRDGSSEDDIYAQKIDANGAIQWKENGTVICNASNEQYSPEIINDGNGGAIITWYDNRSGNYDIFAQKINAIGTVQWNENGMIICNAIGNQYSPQIIRDNSGGIIFAWRDLRNGNQDIYSQKIDSTGNIQWAGNGTEICSAENYQNGPRLVSDGDGGAIITWNDNRLNKRDIYGQKIDSAGMVQWEGNGTVICNTIGIQKNPNIISDGDDGAIIAWSDERNGTDRDDIYAQRIDSSGTTKWEDNGIVICNASDSQENPKIVRVNNGKAIVTWKDKRDDMGDIYAKLITFETKATNGGEIPGYNPIILGPISIITLFIAGVYWKKRNQR